MKPVKIVLALLCSGLGGCAAGFNEEFSCNKVGGVGGCTSMDEVRQNIDLYAQGGASGGASASMVEAKAVNNQFVALPRRNRDGAPVRSEEEVRKVTIFPFVDKTGAYVDTMDIYVTLDDSQWSGRPVQSIKGDE